MAIYELERNAAQQELTVAQPAAGVEWTVTVPVGELWKLRSLFYTFVTSAAVANRIPRIDILDASANLVFEAGNAISYTASSTWRIAAAVNGSIQGLAANTAIVQLFTLPDVWLPAGYSIKSNTALMDVADRYSAVNGLIYVASSSL